MKAAPLEHASLYWCRIMHERLIPFRHKFNYRVFSLLLDLDALPDIARHSAFFRHNSFGLFSFHDMDHGPRDGSPLRPWVETILRQNGLEAASASIRLFCFPRLLGYAFNPLSIYFCHDQHDRLRAILYEVKNTFGDQHGYLIEITDSGEKLLRHGATKQFHVSPFLPLSGDYEFCIRPPADHIAIQIRHTGPEGLRLIATQTGSREAFSDRALIKAWLRHPLMTLKVIGAIHWEALHLWRKGAAFFHRPEAPVSAVSHTPSSVKLAPGD